MDKIRIAVFRDGPFLPPREGGSVSILGMSKGMAKYSDVYLFRCYRGWDDYNLYKSLPFTTIFIKPEDFYSNSGFMHGLLVKNKINVCHFDSTEAVNIQHSFVPEGVLKVWEVHNVDHVLIERLGFDSQAIQTAKDEAVEAGIATDLILARSEKDKSDLLDLGIDPKKISLYKGAIDISQFSFSERVMRNNDIIYLGNLYYGPNENAVKKIINDIAPQVLSKHSSARFVFIGPYPSYLLSLIPQKWQQNIVFMGEVQDINPILADATLGLCPVEQASGTRLKILTYMASGLPVLSTIMGVEGLDEEILNLLTIEDDLNRYPEKILEMLSHKPDMKKLTTARKFIEENYSWTSEAKNIVHEFRRRLSLI